MPSPITQEAIDIINAAPSCGPLHPAEYASALPQNATGLARILGKEEIITAATAYHEADGRAVRSQARFVLMGRLTAYTGFLAAVLGGIVLYIGSVLPDRQSLQTTIGVVQFVLLVISLLGSLALYTLKPFRSWRQSRGEAEAERIRVFALMMASRDGGDARDPLLLPLQLECFRRHLLEDQLDFFTRRGPQHQRTSRRAQILRGLALALIVLAAMPLLAKLEIFAWLPTWVRTLMGWLPLEGKGVHEMYALGGLIGGALQGLLAALAVLSLAERNAEKYARMAERLEDYAKGRLPNARAAAAAGNGLEVGEFARQVASDLAAEASEWVAVQEALASITLERLTLPHRIE